jgi:uncharacterized protein
VFRRNRNGGDGGDLRILFVTDLHGSETCFRKAVSGASIHKVDVLVIGGDLTGKALRPLVETSDGYRVGIHRSTGPALTTDEEVGAFEQQAAATGAYCVKLSERAAMELDDDAIDHLLRQQARLRVRRWAEYAAERLQGSEIRCYVGGGNDDTDDILEAFSSSGSDRIVACDQRVVELAGGVEMVSIGYSNPTPWHTPREVDEAVLSEMIDSVASGMRDPSRGIFNVHVPPRGVGLDRCPELDTSTDPPTPVRIAGEIVFSDAGSTAVLAGIERHQPRLALHGHIHESRAAARIGATLCLNPGSDYRDGVLRAAVVTVSPKHVRHQFISG